MVEAQIEAIEKDIEESHRYRIKLLKKIQPLEEELKALEGLVVEDSNMEYSIPDAAAASIGRTSKIDLPLKKMNQEMPKISPSKEAIFEQNCFLEALNDIYTGKLDILKSSFYDKENLERSLQKYLASDCIEYKEYGLEAYEILSLHQKLLELTLKEKILLQQVEFKDNLLRVPLLHSANLKREEELSELNQILSRQKKVQTDHEDYES